MNDKTPQEIKVANNYIGPKKNRYPSPYTCEYCEHFYTLSPSSSRCRLIGYELGREYSINHNGVCDRWEGDGLHGYRVIPFLEYKESFDKGITIEIKEYLKDVPTRRLLKWLDLTRKTNGCYELSRTKDSIIVVYYDDLKKELATREHIPNKDERKKSRIKKQQAKQNR